MVDVVFMLVLVPMIPGFILGSCDFYCFILEGMPLLLTSATVLLLLVV